LSLRHFRLVFSSLIVVAAFVLPSRTYASQPFAGRAGQTYAAERHNDRVMTPAGGSATACSSVVVVFQTPSSIAAAGGKLSFQVVPPDQTCTWSVTYLPAWVSPNPLNGTGGATVVLTVDPNSGPARTALGSVNGVSFTIQQGPAMGLCTYAFGAPLPDLPAEGTVATLNVVAPYGCPWSAGTGPSWITWLSSQSNSGNGSLAFAVAANTGTPRSGSFQVGDLTAKLNQHGATEGAAGALGHFAAGAGWDTRFTLLNTGTLAAHAHLDFFDDNGRALTAPTSAGLTADPLVAPGALIQLNAPAGTTESQTGWARLSTGGFASGFGIFRLPVGSGYQEAVVPAENRSSSTFVLPYDNADGYFYGVAIANTGTIDQVINVTLRNAADGAAIGTGQFPLAAGGHTQFLLTDRFPQTAGKTGTAEFQSSGTIPSTITLLGLRFNSNHAFTSVPVLERGTEVVGTTLANVGAMTHIAYGGGWTTLITLVNTGSATAHAKLSFFDDNGKAVAIPVSVLRTTINTTVTSTTFSRTIPAGGMAVLECSNTALATGQTGWAQLSTDGGIGGSAVFRYTTNAVSQEAAVPLSTPDASDSILVFDNTGGYDNSVALANNSSVEADVPVTVRDGATGSTLATGTIELPALGHAAFMLRDRFPVTTGKSGSIEFGVSAGQVNVLGLRVNANQAFTSIPPIAKP